jgi:hypothetical protein
LLLPWPPPPPPPFAVPIVGWLLHYCMPSGFVIARLHATVNTLVAGCFCCILSSIATTAAPAAATRPPLPPLPPPWSNSPSSIAEERQQQQHHQHTKGSTCWGRCRHCSGNYEAWRASGRKYEARIAIFLILAPVDRFFSISRKVESR